MGQLETALGALLERAGFRSLSAFSRHCRIGRRTAARLQVGDFGAIRFETLERVACALNLTVLELVTALSGAPVPLNPWQAEYERLVHREQQQAKTLREQWDLEFYRAIELLLLQLPTVRATAEQRPDLSAVTVLDLLSPLDGFVEKLGFEAIGIPGEKTAFDPQLHQGLNLSPGENVRVKTVGYRYRGQLLTRARVVSWV